MKHSPLSLLSLLLAVSLLGVHAESPQPVIPQRPDGIIVLNPESAAFVMTDNTGRHVMNTTEPRLKIADGKIVNPGEGFQFPGWRFQVSHPGKFDVFIEVGTKRSEDCRLRLSFYKDGREGRVIASVPRAGNDDEPVFMGETGLSEGETEVVLSTWTADHPRKLPEIGNVILVPVSAEKVQAFTELLRKSPFAKSEETQEWEEKGRAAATELNSLKGQWNPKVDWKAFQDYSEIVQWERNGQRINELQAEITDLTNQLRAAQLANLQANRDQLAPEEQAILDAQINRRIAWRGQIANDSAKPVFTATPVEAPALYPTGNLDQIKVDEKLSRAPVVQFDVPPSADSTERAKAFAERNSPAGIEQLSRRLHAALRPNVSGLEAYYAAFDAGRHVEALEAYRDYFFRKLKAPSQYGASGIMFVDDFFQSNGKALYLRPPQPDWLADNLAGTGVLFQDNTVWKGNLGAPGTVNWAPEMLRPPEGVRYERGPDASPFWKTPDGKLLNGQINFFRGLNRVPSQAGSSSMFPELLLSYGFSGNRDHLKLYADYLDDWTMNSVRDIENCPVNVRAATELQVIGWYRTLMRTILDERPEFARDFPAASLARLMMALTEIYHPYVMRAKRAEIANWGIMGVDGALNDSKLFHEFRSMDYMNRELLRLARMNWIQHLSLDGENLESWDEGHVAIDGMLERAPELSLHDAPVMGDLERQSLKDHVKTGQRVLMTHYSPEGNYWVSWFADENPARTTIRGKIIDRGLIGDVLDEPEVRSRFVSSLGRTPTRRSLPLSDFQPYASLAYLRDGFGPDSTSLIFQNFPVRSQNQAWGYNGKRGHLVGSMRTQYGVARDSRGLLEASAVLVDGKPPNIFVDATPTGGKTDFSLPTPRNVTSARFLASPEFDVLESSQDSPYRRFDFGFGKDVLGLSQTTPDEPIRDIRAVRQIFQLRGEGIFLIGDRIENRGSAREYSQMFVLPVRVPGPVDSEVDRLRLLAEKDAVLLEIDPVQKRARSLSPELPNVSLYLSGHEFAWGGKSISETQFDTVGSVSAKAVLAGISPSKNSKPNLSINQLLPISVSWRGEGNQALATVVVARPAEDLERVLAKDLTDYREMNGPGGVAGFAFRSPAGTEVWFQIAPTHPAKLEAGPGQVNGGTLLVTRREGRLAGVVMDSKTVTLNGKNFNGPSDAFAFALDQTGAFSATPVKAPIDTVVIQPQQTVFTDKVSVSFGIPTQPRDDLEFRYTLDGSDPTIQSPLYTGPFELAGDTLVKVRPFVKGLKETPWNIAGVEGGKTVSAIFRKTASLPAMRVEGLKSGLNYEYFEESWPVLVSHSGMYPLLPAKGAGEADRLLDADQLTKIRQTDRAYGVKYDGFIEVPETGVYRFFAPDPLYNTTKDAGYELRVWVDEKEWFPNPDLHAENIWSVALDKGLHRLQVSYVDYRWKEFRNEYWMSWNPLQMWEGTPVLEIDGPGIKRQALPPDWLRRK